MTDDPQTPTAPPPPPRRPLRRSSSDRVAAGVAGGLGEYFGIDPVLFRVLFAVTSFFGGAGVIAYLIAWAVIPEQGASRAPLDRVASELRRRRVPLWLVVVLVGLALWAGIFSWWAPRPAFPILIAVVILAIVFARRRPTAPAAPASPASVDSDSTAEVPFAWPPTDGPVSPQPEWLPETRTWITEARATSRGRRHRAAPVRWATLGVLVITMGALALADAVGGILLPVYFWTAGGIVLAGLLVGFTLRRTPWSLTVLLVPAVIGLIAFGGTRASLHDGVGRTTLTPSAAGQLPADYRLAFGQTVVDLRSLPALDAPRTMDITMAAGQVRILAPIGMNLTLLAHVHAGNVEIDGTPVRSNGAKAEDRDDVGGFNLTREIAPPANASGASLTIDVHLAAGQISLEHS